MDWSHQSEMGSVKTATTGAMDMSSMAMGKIPVVYQRICKSTTTRASVDRFWKGEDAANCDEDAPRHTGKTHPTPLASTPCHPRCGSRSLTSIDAHLALHLRLNPQPCSEAPRCAEAAPGIWAGLRVDFELGYALGVMIEVCSVWFSNVLSPDLLRAVR